MGEDQARKSKGMPSKDLQKVVKDEFLKKQKEGLKELMIKLATVSTEWSDPQEKFLAW